VAYELGDDGRVPASNFEDRQRDIVSSLMQVFLEEGLGAVGAALLKCQHFNEFPAES